MKIIHCADLHLDSKLDAFSTEKARIRRDELLNTFENLVDFADKNGVKVIIIAGDVFDSAKVYVKTKSRLLYLINSHSNIDFLYLQGNHEKDSFITSILDDMPKNLKVFSDKWTYFDYGNVTVGGIVLNDLNSKSFYDEAYFKENYLNIAVLHGQIVNSVSSDANLISLPKLKGKNIDYLALGHIHSFSSGILDNARGEYVYSGCLEGRGFDEAGEKGFVLLDTENNRISYKFIPFGKRKICVLNYDISGENNWFGVINEIIKQVKQSLKAEDILRINLIGKCIDGLNIDTEMLKNRLSDSYFSIDIVDKTRIDVDFEKLKDDKSVLGEFTRKVFESDLDDEIKNKVLICGIKAFNGEEIV